MISETPFARLINSYCEATGYTQEELAQKMGLSRVHLSTLKKKSPIKISQTKVLCYAQALQTSPEVVRLALTREDAQDMREALARAHDKKNDHPALSLVDSVTEILRSLAKNDTEGFISVITHAKNTHDKYLPNWVPQRKQGYGYTMSDNKKNEWEEIIHILTHANRDWQYWQDENGRYRMVTPAVELITGYSQEEFLNSSGDLLGKIIHPDDVMCLAEHIIHRDLDLENSIDLRIITKTDEVRWISHLCSRAVDQKGNYRGHLISNRDITERKTLAQ